MFVNSETFVWRRDNYPAACNIRFSGLRQHCNVQASDTVIPAASPVLGPLGRASYRLGGMATAGFRSILNRSNLVHVHFAVDAASLLPVLRRLDLPLVVSLHGFDVLSSDGAMAHLGLRGRILLKRRRELWGRASLFLCASDYLLQQAAKRGYPEARLRRHYIGVPIEELEDLARNQLEAAPAVPKLIFAGRLVENKGVLWLPGLSQYLNARAIDHHLLIVGDGPLRPQLEAAAADRNRSSLQVLGMMPQRRLHELIAGAAAVLAPSRPIKTGESEALNLVALEAAVLGIPIVANRTGGLPEVVVDGLTGSLADPQDPESFYQAVEQLLKSSGQRPDPGATRDHLSQFDKITSRSRLMAIYRTLA